MVKGTFLQWFYKHEFVWLAVFHPRKFYISKFLPEKNLPTKFTFPGIQMLHTYSMLLYYVRCFVLNPQKIFKGDFSLKIFPLLVQFAKYTNLDGRVVMQVLWMQNNVVCIWHAVGGRLPVVCKLWSADAWNLQQLYPVLHMCTIPHIDRFVAIIGNVRNYIIVIGHAFRNSNPPNLLLWNSKVPTHVHFACLLWCIFALLSICMCSRYYRIMHYTMATCCVWCTFMHISKQAGSQCVHYSRYVGAAFWVISPLCRFARNQEHFLPARSLTVFLTPRYYS